jgi:hypothetical protein
MAEVFVTHIIITIAKIFLFCFQMAMLEVLISNSVWEKMAWFGRVELWKEAYMRTQIKMEAENRTRY